MNGVSRFAFLSLGAVAAVLAVNSYVNLRQALPAQAAVSAPSPSPKTFDPAKCGDVADTGRKAGLWKSAHKDGTILVVNVGPAWADTDFDTKMELNGVLRCVSTQGRMDASIDFIDYYDWRNHHQVATWLPDSGLDIKE